MVNMILCNKKGYLKWTHNYNFQLCRWGSVIGKIKVWVDHGFYRLLVYKIINRHVW